MISRGKIFLVWLVVIIITILILSSCAHRLLPMKPVCRHKALFLASIVGEKIPVRIIRGHRNGIVHAEVQAKINGKWQYIKLEYIFYGITVVKPDKRFIPQRIFSNFYEYMDKLRKKEVNRNETLLVDY